MTQGLESPFLFVTCQAGMEAVLKEELARIQPELRAAFSRPGLVTFKDSRSRSFRPDFELQSAFAHTYGLSCLQCRSESPLTEVIEAILSLQKRWEKPLRLHVGERLPYVPDEEPLGYPAARELRLSRYEQQLRLALSEAVFPQTEAEVGDGVVDVLLLEPDQEERSPILVGFHQHARGRRTLNASEFLAVLPPASPSRAYLKIEQAIAWGRLPLRAEDRAIELGSAPGGASFALLLRGLEVWGIDPGAMDPVVWSDPRCENRFHHVKKAFSGVLRGDLPAQAQWLALDINGPARVSLPYVETLAGWFSESLLGVILTLKVNDPKNAKHLPEWLERVETLGFRQVRAAQLPSHKREVCIVGLSKKGLLRGSSTH